MGTVRLSPTERRLIESRLDLPECLFEVLEEEIPGLTESQVEHACARVLEAIQGPFDPESLSLLERAVLRDAIEGSTVFGDWEFLEPWERGLLERAARGVERKLGIRFPRY